MLAARAALELDICHARPRMVPMKKIQVYLRDEELEALHETARRSGRSMSELVREAVRQVWLRPQSRGPVALWDGEPRRSSLDHDTIYDEPLCGKA
jgi:hypothetical protein